jgi:hypothetical protein
MSTTESIDYQSSIVEQMDATLAKLNARAQRADAELEAAEEAWDSRGCPAWDDEHQRAIVWQKHCETEARAYAERTIAQQGVLASMQADQDRS